MLMTIYKISASTIFFMYNFEKKALHNKLFMETRDNEKPKYCFKQQQKNSLKPICR